MQETTSTTPTADNGLPPVVHHIAISSAEGKSTFQDPAEKAIVQALGPGMQMAYLYSSPASFSIPKGSDFAYHESAPKSPSLRGFPPPAASTLVVMDIGPNPNDKPTFMHRTQTLDYLVMLEGEMELSLDSSEKRIVRRGEVVVQRAPMHAWKNTSKTHGARMLCVAIGSEEAVQDHIEFEA